MTERRYRLDYSDEEERDKLLRKLKKADIKESAITDDPDNNTLLIAPEFSETAKAVYDAYNKLKQQREERLEG